MKANSKRFRIFIEYEDAKIYKIFCSPRSLWLVH